MSFAAVVYAGAAVVGGAIASRGAKKAAGIQAGAARDAAQLQADQFNQSREDQMPWHQAGVESLTRLKVGLRPNGQFMQDFGESDFNADPGYQFRLSQGRQGMESSQAARGGLYSGAALKEAGRFNQGLASQEYGNAYNRFQTNRSNKLNALQSMAGLGQTSAGQVANLGANSAANQGNALMGAGEARASGYVGQANALNSGISQLSNMYQQNRAQNQLQRQNSLNSGTSNYANSAYSNPNKYSSL